MWVETAFQMGNEYGLRSSFRRAEKIFGDLKKFTDRTLLKRFANHEF